MNIAFPAFLIFLLILPGFIFYLTYHNRENTQLSYEPFTQKTIKIIFVAFGIHLLGIQVLKLLSHQIDFELILLILFSAKDLIANAQLNILAKESDFILSYLFSSYLVAWMLAKLTRYVIKKFNLDRKTSLFRPENEWYYLFNGYESNQVDGIAIAATTELAGKGYLYVGYLKDYFLDDKGNIERFVLTNVVRREIANDKKYLLDNINSNDYQRRFYIVDGDYFVLKYSEIKTLNIQFIKIE